MQATFALPRERAHGTPSTVYTLLRDALDDSTGDRERLLRGLERPFEQVMDQEASWYERRVQLVLWVLALVLVVAVNADTFTVAPRLWNDSSTRAAALTQVNEILRAGRDDCAQISEDENRAEAAAKCVEKATRFPLGYSASAAPHDFNGVLARVFGLLVSVIAVALGAPFWRGLLYKVAPPSPNGAERVQA